MDVQAWAQVLGGRLCGGPERYQGAVRGLGAVTVSSLHSSALELRGEGRGTGSHLALVRGGELVLEQAGRTARIEAGGLGLLDSTRPYRMRLAGSWNSVTTAHLGRGARPYVPGTSRETPVRPALAAPVAAFLAGLADDTTPRRPGDELRLGTVVAELVAVLLEESGEGDAERADGAPLPRIQAYIVRHLGQERLTPDRIAAAHHISTRYLHLLFQRQGLTVASWIKEQRLERCRRDLADPGLRQLPVHAIAARWGFERAADFSRAFRGAYGTTPTCFRAGAAPATRVRSLPRNSAPSANDTRVPAQQTPRHGEARPIHASVHMGELHG